MVTKRNGWRLYTWMPFLGAMLAKNGRKWRQTISLVINANLSCLYDICYSKYKDKLHFIKIVLISRATNVWKLITTLVLRDQNSRSTTYFLCWKNNNFLYNHWILENLHVRNCDDIWHTMRLSDMQKYDVWRNKWSYCGLVDHSPYGFWFHNP